MKKIFNLENIKRCLMIFILLQPLLDLYILFEAATIDILHISPSTIIRYLYIAFIVILFLFTIKNKKDYKYYIIYFVLVVSYVVLHHINSLNFTSNFPGDFNYSLFGELSYLVKMSVPLIILYVTTKIKFKENKIENVILTLSFLFSATIVLTNVFKISIGAYETKLIEYNIIDWFYGIHNTHSFYDTATRGYFTFANMISVLLFGFIPFIMYYLMKYFDIKKVLVLITQFLAMFMLGTKVATLGLVIMIVLSIVIYLYFTIIKKEMLFDKKVFVCLSVLCVFWFLIYPYSPCYNRISGVSQSISDKQSNDKIQNLRLSEEEIAKMDSDEKNEYYLSFVKNYYKDLYLKKEYVINSYSYKFDSEFWYNFSKNDIAQRIDNRYNLSKIYKRIATNSNNKYDLLFGLSRTRLDNVGVLERDFVSQYYSLGIVGLALFIFPYIACIMIMGINLLLNYKKKLDLKNILFIVGNLAFMFGAYSAGNSFDGLTFSIIVSFLIGITYQAVFRKENVLSENKVTIMALSLGVGGVEKYISSLSKMLHSEYEIEIISTYKVFDKPAFDLPKNVKVTYLINDKPHKEELKSSIKQKNVFKIIKYFYVNAKILVLKTTRNIKAISDIDSKYIITTRFHSLLVGVYAPHNSIKIATEHNYHNNNKKYVRSIIKSVENFDYLVCVSKNLQEYYQSKLLKCKSIYIPNVVESLPKYTKSNNKNKLITVGRLSYEKGYSDLIDIVGVIKRDIPDIRLNIIGDGEEKWTLQNKINELNLNDNIKLLGFKNSKEINKYMQESNLYVMTSLTESFGLVLIEAMSNRLPCIAFDSADGAKNLLSDSVGVLVKNRSKKEMSKKIIELLSNQKQLKKYAKNGFESCQQYLMSNVKEEWIKMLKNSKEEQSFKNYFKNLYTKSTDSFYKLLKDKIVKEEKTFIITANPETFMFGKTDEVVNEMLLDKENSIVPDGISIVKACKMLNIPVKERIAGVDITVKLLELANELKRKMYFFGSKEEVLCKLKSVIDDKYPNIKVVGMQNGYVSDKERVFDDIVKTKPDILIVALGIPLQEKLIYTHLAKFQKGIMIGVGGSLDVISGSKKRAPKFFIKCNLEWLYRLIKEPKRIKRFYNSNVKFMMKIKKEKNGDV